MSELQTSISYEDMLKAGMHFGRKKTVFNPMMERYTFTVRDGICIIDLTKTQAQLKNTAEYLKKVIQGGGIILFVALTKQSVDPIKDLAVSLNMPYAVDRWLGGTLTNFKIISDRVKKLIELEQSQVRGEFEKYTKKEQVVIAKELQKMRTRFDGLKKLTRLPDIVFVSSLKESALPVHEAKIAGVKVAAIANTDANPEEVDYVIPANDRSKRSVDLIVQLLKSELSSVKPEAKA